MRRGMPRINYPAADTDGDGEKALRSFQLWRLPVQPEGIAAQEGIVVRPGLFGDTFHYKE